MTGYDPNIRYWHVCLVDDNKSAIQRLTDFIGNRATFLTTEQDENQDVWAVLDVRDHSILDDLALLDCVALTPGDEAFVTEAWPEMSALKPH